MNQLALTGILLHDAEVRSKPGPHGFLPVLCLDLQDVGPGHHFVHAEHAYTEATRQEAERQARRLKKGMRITVTTAPVDLRLTLPHVEFHVESTETEESAS